jgi:sugar phosphate isomerase/epimerase
MKYSNYSIFSTDMHRLGLEAAVEHTLKMGFNAIEHIENTASPEPKLKSLSDAVKMKEYLDEHNLSVSCYSLVLNLLADDASSQMDNALRHVEYARALGSPFVHHTLIPGYDKTKKIFTLDEALEKIAEDAAKVAKFCNDNGMICLYEPQGLYFNGVDGVRAILDEMRSRGLKVGVCGDTGNSLFVDVDPVDIFRAFSDDILHVHVKDYCYGRGESGQHVSYNGKMIKETRFLDGDCHIKECLAQIPNYQGDVSFEFNLPDEEMINAVKSVKDFFGK